MAAEPWDVPITIEGREQLTRLIATYRASGQTRELGICLSRMSYMVKQIGPKGKKNAFVESAKFAEEAVQLLRLADDKKELIRALRYAVAPWVTGVDHAALLTESLSIAREIGDKEQEGWTIYRMTKASGVAGFTMEQALECFEACNCVEGKATCLMSMGFLARPKKPELLKEAITLFETVGDHDQAKKAKLMLTLCEGD